MDVGDLGKSGRSLRDLLGLLNDLLGVLLNSLCLLLDNLGQLFDLLLKRFLILSLFGLFSGLDLLVDFLGNLRSDGHFSVLGLLLNSFGLDLKSLDGILNGDDLGVDGNILLLILLELGGLSLDASLGGFNFRFEVGDFILNLGLVFLLLGGSLLGLELLDFLGMLGDSVLVSLDVSLLLDNSVSNNGLLSVVLFSLLLNSDLGLVGSVLMSNGILSNGDSSVFVLVSVVSSANSVDASSLNLLIFLKGVVRSSLNGGVGSVVCLPGGSDLGQSGGVGGDARGDISDVLLVLLDLTLDRLNFLFDSLLFVLLDLLESLLKRFNSRGKILLLRSISGKQALLLIDLLGPGGHLFLMLLLLLGELNSLRLVLGLFLLMLVLLLHNISGLDTLLDVSNGFFLRVGSLSLGILNLLSHLSDHGSGVSNSAGLLSLLLSLSLDDFLGGGDLVGHTGQLLLESLNISRLGGSGHLGGDFLLLGSELRDLLFVGRDGLFASFNNLGGSSDNLFKLLSLFGSNFFNSSSFFSQLSSNLLLLNDLGRDVGGRGGSGRGGSSSDVTGDGNSSNDTWIGSGGCGG